MRHRLLASIGVLAVAMAIVWLTPSCSRETPTSAANGTGAAAASTPLRTPWGDPDLRGLWENRTSIPFERAKEFGTREFMTEQEAAERAARRAQGESTSGTPTPVLPVGEAEEVGDNLAEADVQRFAAANAVPDNLPGKSIVGAEYNAFWNAPVNARKRSLRTSQIVDPPDGRLPSYTREVMMSWDARERERQGRGQGDTWADRGMSERCLPAPPTGGGGGVRDIYQTPGYVAIHTGSVRIIPLDGRPQLGETLRQWTGDSRGRWEGNTLVVETTNFNHKLAGEILPAHGGIFGGGHSHNYAGTGETLRVVERFTRIDAETIEYRYTIEDPKVFVRPWTAVNILSSDNRQPQMYENACHEHNYGMVNALAGARANEAESLKEAARELNFRQPGVKSKWEQLKQWEASQKGSGSGR